MSVYFNSRACILQFFCFSSFRFSWNWLWGSFIRFRTRGWYIVTLSLTLPWNNKFLTNHTSDVFGSVFFRIAIIWSPWRNIFCTSSKRTAIKGNSSAASVGSCSSTSNDPWPCTGSGTISVVSQSRRWHPWRSSVWLWWNWARFAGRVNPRVHTGSFDTWVLVVLAGIQTFTKRQALNYKCMDDSILQRLNMHFKKSRSNIAENHRKTFLDQK